MPTSCTLVVLVVDLAGYTKSFQSHSDLEMAAFLDAFCGAAEGAISARGGRVIKFIGDAVLAVYPRDHASQAVASTVELEVAVARLAAAHRLDVSLGANLHMGPVVECELGRGGTRRPDVIGRVVNQTFLLGRGSGIRISEPVYRQLPSAERSPWDKRKPPAVYVLGQGGEPYAGLRQSAADNAARW